MPPPHRTDALSDDARLYVCLSVTYIEPKLRTERPMKIKWHRGAHVTRDSDTTIKVKRSKVKLQGSGRIVAASRTAC